MVHFGVAVQIVREGYGKLARMAKALSGGSFCVYLVHLLVLRVLAHVGFSTSCFRPAVSVPFLTLLCLLGSYCIYLILKRIPWVKRWLI